MRSCVVLSFVAALAVAVPQASAQSLAEVAAKEKERREKLKKQEADKAGKAGGETSFSEEDLDRARRSGARIGDEIVAETPGEAAASAPAAEPGAAAAAPAEKTEDEQRAEAEADWRKRLEEAEAERTKVDEEITTVQAALADNTQSMFGTARQARLDRLEEATAMRVDVEARIQALELEGRRSRYRR